MKSKKALLKNSVLCVILDRDISGARPMKQTAAILRDSGADIVQLRDKRSDKRAVYEEAERLRPLFAGTKTLFIINDYADIALSLDCDGVHLGQRDMPLEAARGILGRKKIIGISCSTITQALEAQKNGADYIGIGPVFVTSTKPEAEAVGLKLLRECAQKIRIPFFAIGGINNRSLPAVLTAGAGRICMCRAILKAPDVSLATGHFKQLLNSPAAKTAGD